MWKFTDTPTPLPDDDNSRYMMEKFRRLLLEFNVNWHLHHIDIVKRRPSDYRENEIQIRLVMRESEFPWFDQSHLLAPVPVEPKKEEPKRNFVMRILKGRS